MLKEEKGLEYLKNSNSSKSEPQGMKRTAEANDQENLDLGSILAILRRRMAVIASVAVVVTSLALVLALKSTQKYEGRFQLLVEPLTTSDSQLLVLLSQTLKENVNEITKNNSTSLDYQALMQVLRSPKLMVPVVEKLKTQYQEISYDSIVGYDGAGKLVNGKPGALDISRLTKGKDESRVIEVRYRDSDPQKIQLVLNEVSKSYLKYSLQQQQTNLRQGIKFVNAQIPKLQVRVDTLQKQLQIYQQQYSLFNPELQGPQLLNRADVIKTQQLETQKKLAEAKSLYASLQKQLGQEENVAIAATVLSEDSQYQNLKSRIQEVETKIAKESVRFRDETPSLQSLRQEKQNLLVLLNKQTQNVLGKQLASATVNSSAPTFQNSVRRDLTQQLANAANQIKLLDASNQTNTQALNLVNQQIKQYPVVARQYANLQRDLQLTTDTLNQLLAKREALRVDAAQQEVPWELITPPTIPRDKTGKILPLPSGRSRNILLGGVAGVLLGIVTAFVLENLNNVFHRAEEVKRATKLPLLGVIPFNKEYKKLASVVDAINLALGKSQQIGFVSNAKSGQYKVSIFLEVFRSLYAKVQFLKSDDTPIRSFAISSVTVGDGKSTVAAYLAQVAAETGQMVLLVDADLRHPQLHAKFGIPNTKGLSDVLCKNIEFSEAIQQSPSEDNLFVLTSGQILSNPTKLLSSKNMRYLAEQLLAKFDLVIYDTPPLLGLPDSNLVAIQTQGMLLIVGLGKTERFTFKQALDELGTSRVSILGMVANGVK